MEEYKKHLELNHALSNLRPSPLIVTTFQVASIWIVSDIGYQSIKTILGINITYTNNPLLITFYYIFWIFVTVSAFWDIYIKWQLFKNEVITYSVVLFIIGFIASYIIYILPLFPSITWTPGLTPPPELAFANGWYFLPKSTEIILQQLLISTLALSFYNSKYTLKTTMLWCAGLFGSAHLLLIFTNPSLIYISIFTISALISGFVFPYFILRVKNGFMYSYMLHWTFYALIIILAHKLFTV
jgi:hypothetical protein